jgi:uncharacterized protein YjbJ (UPF0337 family)
MGYLDEVSEKIKGKTEEVKGEINQQRGKGVKGGMQKIKGKARQKIADLKEQAGRAGAKGDNSWDQDDDW